jgi:hypothetical protein
VGDGRGGGLGPKTLKQLRPPLLDFASSTL